MAIRATGLDGSAAGAKHASRICRDRAIPGATPVCSGGTIPGATPVCSGGTTPTTHRHVELHLDGVRPGAASPGSIKGARSAATAHSSSGSSTRGAAAADGCWGIWR